MLSLSDTQSSDSNVTVAVGDENSVKAGSDKELGDCSSWDEDKSERGKLSCLSPKVRAMTELLDGSCSSLDDLNLVTSSFFSYRFLFQLSFHFQDRKET